jgi:hypothetical protein
VRFLKKESIICTSAIWTNQLTARRRQYTLSKSHRSKLNSLKESSIMTTYDYAASFVMKHVYCLLGYKIERLSIRKVGAV